ncbi:hypothetical protein BALOs_0916 [Halobacteriovorax sp. BALOs_7]|uniref:hypothetical protein n=1 Tax=unclassified Halobacteriovorax TaxID=2639665 RepID=UPI000EB761D0|nr:hypothetical protein [Halobacteriovorax sp. BALOs_7]AYF43926.1 hypothetical protein BALOs_0916 [Halobacteriovorax sp. BALOs_7]
MKNLPRLIVPILLMLTHGLGFAFDLSSEVEKLNEEYRNTYEYPIIIFDKNEIAPKLVGLEETDQIEIVKNYTLDVHDIELSHNEAVNLVPYFTSLNGAASAIPFFERGWGKELKFCAVLPNGIMNDLSAEVRRVLGDSKEVDVYENFDFSRFENLFTLEELYLYSLYHELSHCLDQNFMLKNYSSSPSAHGVHEAESFAEVNALFLLAQKKGMRNLGAKRSLLRKTYSQYMGPYLASDKVSTFAGPIVKKGGSVYFLTPAIIAAQRELENYKKGVMDFNLEQTLALSKEVVEHHAINSRSFQALNKSFKDGSEEAKRYYRDLSQRDPDLFLATYYDLLYLSVLLDR